MRGIAERGKEKLDVVFCGNIGGALLKSVEI
jgi:hypothetical protein